jgi:CopG family nickel-responsive transcriptional regulator
MQRLTMSLEDELAAAVDAFATARGYASRSEAMRDLLRAALAREAEAARATYAVAAVSFVFQPQQRELAQRLAALLHERHDLVLAATQTPLDHGHALQVALLRGPAAPVRGLAEALVRERGVRFGQVNLVPLAEGADAHSHDALGPAHAHQAPAL